MTATGEKNLCPVCGCALFEGPWIGDSASDEICKSCGIHFGYDDASGRDDQARVHIYTAWRKKWIKAGMPWFSKSPAPSDWNPRQQLSDAGIDFQWP